MRFWDPEHPLLVTNRCHQQRMLLLPKPDTVRLVREWLARSLSRHGRGIELYAFFFMSDHFHLILRDKDGSLPKFMCCFQRDLARAINRRLGNRRGEFFEREYHAAPLLSDHDFEHAYAYVLTNAVKENLVARAADGPFFSSLALALDEKPRAVTHVDRTKRHNLGRNGRKVLDREATDTYLLELAIPPAWKQLRGHARRRRILDLVRGKELLFARRRRAERRGIIGAARVAALSPLSKARTAARSVRPRVYGADPEIVKAYTDALALTARRYREAMAAFRSSASDPRRPPPPWPPWTYPPSSMTPVSPRVC